MKIHKQRDLLMIQEKNKRRKNKRVGKKQKIEMKTQLKIRKNEKEVSEEKVKEERK